MVMCFAAHFFGAKMVAAEAVTPGADEVSDGGRVGVNIFLIARHLLDSSSCLNRFPDDCSRSCN
jgi:hypothetical protein